MQNKNLKNIGIFCALFLVASLSRLVPHQWNFTFLIGSFLFAGAYFQDKKISVLLMLSVMLFTDYVIGFHNQMVAVYLSYLLVLGLGVLLKTDSSRFKKLGFAISGSALFFVITNLGVWFEGSLYPMSTSGLVQCFVMAIPFYKFQILGDILSTLVLFEVYPLVFKSSEVSANNQKKA